MGVQCLLLKVFVWLLQVNLIRSDVINSHFLELMLVLRVLPLLNENLI